MKKILLIFLVLFCNEMLFAQVVTIIDTLGDKTIYLKSKIRVNIDGHKFTEKPFLIDVPNDLNYKYYKHNVAQKIHGIIFTNATSCLVVQISEQKYENNYFWSGKFEQLNKQNIPEKFVSVEDIAIKHNLYCGYYFYKNYFVYYYNVVDDDVGVYNSSIKSIRKNKKRNKQ